MTHGAVIICTDCDIVTHRHHFYCEYTSVWKNEVSVNSHQNSHDAHRQAMCIFVVLLWYKNIQRFVVPLCCFGSFRNPLAFQMFLCGDCLYSDCSFPHENDGYHNPSKWMWWLTGFQTQSFGPSSPTLWVTITLFSLMFIYEKHDPTKDSHPSANIFVFFNNIRNISLIICGSVEINTMNTKILYY